MNGQPDPLRPPHLIRPEVLASISVALMRAMALDTRARPLTTSEMRAQLHGKTPHVSNTIPNAGEDETTKVSVATNRPRVTIGAYEPNLRHYYQVVVPVPEDTWVAAKQGGRWKK